MIVSFYLWPLIIALDLCYAFGYNIHNYGHGSRTTLIHRSSPPFPQKLIRNGLALLDTISDVSFKDDMNNNTAKIDSTAEDDWTKYTDEVPSISKILKFSIPAMGIFLCSPLLSMIDTSTVGLFCGTLDQAALNPAVTIVDYSARTMSFLYTGTTNMLASSTQNRNDDQIKDAFLGSLKLAGLVGSSLGIVLLLTGQRLLVPLVGNNDIDVEVLRSAWRYVAIRSLGMPGAAMIGTSQAACLGLEDNKTPFKIILVAASVNLILDLLLVRIKRLWIGGTAGVAWATAIAQYVALFLFLRSFAGKSKFIQDKKSDPTSSNGLLRGRLTRRTWLKLPNTYTLEQFKPYVIPVTMTQIGRCSTYIAMGHVVSSTLDAVAMAAQQIITSIFYALIPIGDSCSLTAQTFLPPLVIQKPTKKRTLAVKKTIQNIFKVACALGVILSLIAGSIPLACRFLTTDPMVTATVKSAVPAMMIIFSTHGIFCASEGVLLGFKDLKFLGRIYASFFTIIPLLMLRLKSAARAGKHVPLRSVWEIFLRYQAFRILAFFIRLLYVRRRHGKEVKR